MIAAAGVNPRRTNILVVDDESHVREIVCHRLRGVGYSCQTANSVAMACDLLQRQSFELVTSDIGMPGRSGIELLHLIKKQYPDTAVLMLTGNVDTQVAIRAMSDGAHGYLIKPVQRDELLRQVEMALGHRALMIENREYKTQLERKVCEQTQHIHLAHQETIQRLLVACMYRDEETGGHIKRTGLSSALVAQALGWPKERVELIRLAAPMHDVGKVAIPDSILLKPGKLTPEEFAIMQTHTTLGARMLAGSPSPILQMAEQIALGHHEHWDGRGYPQRLSGDEIPEAARILAIVDVFDALTHDRVYRKAFPEAEVLDMIRAGNGTHFEPRVVQAFFAALTAIRTVNVGELDEDFGDPIRHSIPAFESRFSALESLALQT